MSEVTGDGGRISPGGAPVPGLYAAGEAAGFGGGGVHGYRALEGTFLGGCVFSGRAAGSAAVVIATQLGIEHWFYLYIPWFFPLVMVSLLGSCVSESK